MSPHPQAPVPPTSESKSNGSSDQLDVMKHQRNRSSFDGTKYKDGTWSTKNEEILLAPYEYMHQHRGKEVRSQLIQAFNEWLQVPPESLQIITEVVTLLHTSSLL